MKEQIEYDPLGELEGEEKESEEEVLKKIRMRQSKRGLSLAKYYNKNNELVNIGHQEAMELVEEKEHSRCSIRRLPVMLCMIVISINGAWLLGNDASSSRWGF